MPPVRTKQCTQGIYQVVEASIGETLPPRDPINNVSGRYAGDGPDEGRAGETPIADNITSGSLGVHCEPREVTAGTSPDNSIPGISDQFYRNENQVDRGEGGIAGDDVQEHTIETVPLSPGTGQSDRQDDGHSPCYPSGTSVVPGVATFEESSLETLPVLRPAGEVVSGSSVGARMVVH